VTYLLDTDHITILRRETAREYATLRARLAQHPPTELACPIISLHEQVVGCHTYINQARTATDLVWGYQRWQYPLSPVPYCAREHPQGLSGKRYALRDRPAPL